MAKSTTKTTETPVTDTVENINPDESVQEFQQDLIGEGEVVSDATVTATTEEVQTSDADVPGPVVTGKGVAELDRGRDYAQVFGKPGVAYEQDHKYFNAEGIAVNPELEA